MKRFFTALALGVFLTSCSQSALTGAYENLGTSALWNLYSREYDPRRSSMIEAELASRGEFKSGVNYVGMRSSNLVGMRRFSRSPKEESASNDLDCGDFSSSALAQKFFLSQGGPQRDAHNLDGDGDGMACEWGKTVKRAAKKYRPKPVHYSSPRRSYSKKCYVGPRGGTYTLTASGRKNYGGC